MSLDNYVQMEEIKDEQSTMDKSLNLKFNKRLSMENPSAWVADISETRVVLSDSILNWLDLVPPKQYNYVNIEGKFS